MEFHKEIRAQFDALIFSVTLVNSAKVDKLDITKIDKEIVSHPYLLNHEWFKVCSNKWRLIRLRMIFIHSVTYNDMADDLQNIFYIKDSWKGRGS